MSSHSSDTEAAIRSPARPAWGRRIFIGFLLSFAVLTMLIFVFGPRWIEAPVRELVDSEAPRPPEPSRYPVEFVELSKALSAFEISVEGSKAFDLLEYSDDSLVPRDLTDEERTARELLEAVYEPFDTALLDSRKWLSMRVGDEFHPAVRDRPANPAPTTYFHLRLASKLRTRAAWAFRAGDTETMDTLRDIYALSTYGFRATDNIVNTLVTSNEQRTATRWWVRLAMIVPPKPESPRPQPFPSPAPEVIRKTCEGERRLIVEGLRSQLQEGEVEGRWEDALQRLGFARTCEALELVSANADRYPDVDLEQVYQSHFSKSLLSSAYTVAKLPLDLLLISVGTLERQGTLIPLLELAFDGEPIEPVEPFRIATLEDGTRILFDSTSTTAPADYPSREAILEDPFGEEWMILPEIETETETPEETGNTKKTEEQP